MQYRTYAIECSTQVRQSLAFISGYSTHQYLERSKSRHICRDILTIDKDLIDDLSISQFKLLDLSERGSLKYPSEIVLESSVIVWKIFMTIKNNNELMVKLLEGPSRKILVELSTNSVLDCNISVISGIIAVYSVQLMVATSLRNLYL